MLDLLVCNPFRPVDALWRRAVGIDKYSEPRASLRRDGEGCVWIKKAQRFRRARARATTWHEKMRVYADHSAVSAAFSIYDDLGPDAEAARVALQARILARQTDNEIAQQNGCVPEAVKAYEALFFNVRGRLDNRDFISNCVIRSNVADTPQNCSTGTVWKLFAYYGGPRVLEAVMSRLPAARSPESPADVSAFFEQVASDVMQQNAAIAAVLVPINSRTHSQLIRLLIKNGKSKRATPTADAQVDHVEALIKEILAFYEPLLSTGMSANTYKIPGIESLEK